MIKSTISAAAAIAFVVASCGSSATVEPTTSVEPVEPVETTTSVEPVETTTSVEPVEITTSVEPVATEWVMWLGYDCDDGTPFWISDLGVSFDGPEGPWDPSVTTQDEWSFEDICDG
jgi:hypothetical protein